jgi:hypothetical protein
MPEADFETLPLRFAYTFLEAHGRGAEAEEIRRSGERLGSYTTTLKRARVTALLQRDGLLDQFIREHWPNGATPKGRQLVERFARIYERYESAGPAVDKVDPESEEPTGTGFAYEEHLRDFLADHLERLESGLHLWPVGPDADAVEFPVNGRRIDILAQDNHGIPVIIELKVSRGHEKTIGQCLYYRAKTKELFKQDTVRIFIVAQEISDELKLATRELKDVVLFEYALSMNVRRL